MAMNRTPVVGVFDDRTSAERAVRDLEAAGFRRYQIGVAVRGGDSTFRLARIHLEETAETKHIAQVLVLRCRDDCPVVRTQLEQALGRELEERFAYGRGADTQRRREVFLL